MSKYIAKYIYKVDVLCYRNPLNRLKPQVQLDHQCIIKPTAGLSTEAANGTWQKNCFLWAEMAATAHPKQSTQDLSDIFKKYLLWWTENWNSVFNWGFLSQDPFSLE